MRDLTQAEENALDETFKYHAPTPDQLVDYAAIREAGKVLARTILTPAGLGRTYWCRASGWLMYALTSVLRHLSSDDPQFGPITRDLRTLADGVAASVGPAGGLRALANDPTTPEETTGTAMCLASVLEAVQHGWLPDIYGDWCRRAWNFLLQQIEPDGTINGVYTGWAMTAEEGRIIMDQGRRDRGWIPSVVLFAACQQPVR